VAREVAGSVGLDIVVFLLNVVGFIFKMIFLQAEK
jgi:hypothetical protein